MTELEHDPRARLLVVTLMHREPDWAHQSQREALRWYMRENPTARVDVLQVYGKDPHGFDDPYAIVVWKYRQVQETIRAGAWQTVITLEDDMVVPEDVIARLLDLLENGADIGYGLYVWRKTKKWSAYPFLNWKDGVSLSEDQQWARCLAGDVIDVEGVGLGCTAIKRHVLEAITWKRPHAACNDWDMAYWAQLKGYVQRCDLSLVCGHVDTDSGLVYWPDPEAPDLWRAEELHK